MSQKFSDLPPTIEVDGSTASVWVQEPTTETLRRYPMNNRITHKRLVLTVEEPANGEYGHSIDFIAEESKELEELIGLLEEGRRQLLGIKVFSTEGPFEGARRPWDEMTCVLCGHSIGYLPMTIDDRGASHKECPVAK
jgi:hypothetical protein